MPGARHLLEVLITGNSRGAIAALDQFEQKASKSFGAATTGSQKFEASLVRGGAAAVGFAAIAGAGLLNAAQSTAVLEQRVAATGKIFKDARGPVDEFSKGAAQVAGLSEAEARATTTRIGSLLQSYGFSADEAAAKSIELTKIGADLALTYGTDVEQAVSAVAATLRGERDPIEQYGVGFKEADVQNRILTLGLKTGTAATNAHAKAVATLDIVQERTASSAGAFAESTDTAAGKLAIFRAEMKNLQANIGAGALPALTAVTGTISSAASAFNELPESGRNAAGGIATAVTAGAGVAGVMALAAGGALKAKTGFQNLASQMPKTAGAIGIAGAALAGFTALMAIPLGQDLSADLDDLTESANNFAKSGLFEGELARVAGINASEIGNMLATARELRTGDWLGGIDQLGSRLADPFSSTAGLTEINRANEGLELIDQTLVSLVSAGNIEGAANLFRFLGEQATAQGESVDELTGRLPEYAAELEQVAAGQRAAAGATDLHAQAIEGVRDALKDERSRIDAALGFEKVLSARERLTDLQKEQALVGRTDSDAARRAADAQQSVADAVRSRSDAVKGLLDAQQDLATFVSAEESKVRGLEREQILRRRIGSAEEARQKEIDLYRFDQRVAQEGERLNEGVVSAERGVEDATRRVGDAHADVAEQARDRAEKEKDYAAEIRKAQLDIDAAALGVAETYIKTADELGTNSTAARLLYAELEKIAFLVGPDSMLGKGLLDLLVTTGDIIAGLTLSTGKTFGELFSEVTAAARVSGAGAAGSGKVYTREDLERLKLIPGRATGGVVSASTPYVVGERGPELFVPSSAGSIVPGGKYGGGDVNINQNVQFVGGDIPTVTQLDAQNRKLGIRVALSGRRG